MNYLLIILLSAISLGVYAQKGMDIYIQKNSCTYYFDKKLNQNIYTTPTLKPEYKQGEYIFIADLINNIDIPVEDIHNIFWEESINSLLCKLIINSNGSILSIRIVMEEENKDSHTKLKKLEKSIIKAAKKLPKWKPAQCNGKNVIYSTYFEIRQSAFKMPNFLLNKNTVIQHSPARADISSRPCVSK